MEELDSKYSRMEERVVVAGRYVMLAFEKRVGQWNIYEGVERNQKVPVIIHVKLSKNGQPLRYRKDLHNKMPDTTCKLLWDGDQLVGKLFYHMMVFERMGPSLKHVLKLTHYHLPLPTTMLLLCNLLGLLQKLAQGRLVMRPLKPSRIYLYREPTRTDLLVGEFTDVCKAGQSSVHSHSKYASIGAHLGLNASLKDDLESICYLVFNILLEGAFFPLIQNEKKKNQELLAWKSDLRIDRYNTLPDEVRDLYLYCRGLALTQMPNYEHWRKLFRRTLGPDILKQPYAWTRCEPEEDDKECQVDEDESTIENSLPASVSGLEKFHLSELTMSIRTLSLQPQDYPKITISRTESIQLGSLEGSSESDSLEDFGLADSG